MVPGAHGGHRGAWVPGRSGAPMGGRNTERHWGHPWVAQAQHRAPMGAGAHEGQGCSQVAAARGAHGQPHTVSLQQGVPGGPAPRGCLPHGTGGADAGPPPAPGCRRRWWCWCCPAWPGCWPCSPSTAMPSSSTTSSPSPTASRYPSPPPCPHPTHNTARCAPRPLHRPAPAPLPLQLMGAQGWVRGGGAPDVGGPSPALGS